MKNAIILIAVLFIPAIAYPAVIHVPGDQPTIQAGIDAAVNGDSVLVAPGTYVENINFNGKDILVKGTSGAIYTVIDAGSAGSGVIFQLGETSNAVLEGFTITNGTGTYGPGSINYGGGVLVLPGAGNPPAPTNPIIRYNHIINNTITGAGGGIHVDDNCSPFIEDNYIHNNAADWGGGGIACLNRSLLVSTSPTIHNNTINGNTTGSYYGGGIYLSEDVNALVTNNLIEGNTAPWGSGGGLFIINSRPKMDNNIICNNTVRYRGGGIYTHGAGVLITNNTITGNWVSNPGALDGGGGIYFLYNSLPVITNTILWDNTAPTGPEIYIADAHPTVSYSDVEGGQSWVHIAYGSGTLTWGAGNIDANPDFLIPGFDCHLGWESPCINMGTNTGAPAIDIDGDSRPYMGSIDMGADEFPGPLALEADAFTVSEAAGGTVNLALDARVTNASRDYLVLGSVSGRTPGYVLPGGYFTLPITWDWFTDLELTLLNTVFFQNVLGTLGADGKAASVFYFPGYPGTAGMVICFAYCCNNPFDFTSNPVEILVVP
ncbi:MAG: right-handed parallel beta-helix repeat-containing protein [Planctomycetota bacterium]|jgi:hypothetical protein